jgi:hypothetical protein
VQAKFCNEEREFVLNPLPLSASVNCSNDKLSM